MVRAAEDTITLIAPATSSAAHHLTVNQQLLANVQPLSKDYGTWPGYPRRPHIAPVSTAAVDSKVAGAGVTITWSNLNVYARLPRSALDSPRDCCWGARDKYASSSKWNNTGFKQVLSGVYGAVEPGNLVAVMGSSGSGKSTLMTALAQRSPAGLRVEGDIRYNSVIVGKDALALTAFVYQHDIFVGSLTVREHLEFVARLRLGRNVGRERRRQLIDSVLDSVGLTHCHDTTIGLHATAKSLSGGEKKRLAFASEVLTDPAVLLCDEPTSGLDSHNAERIVALLHQLASRDRKTVVCTIHQPSAAMFNMFDQLLLLVEGRVAFLGTPRQASNFFSNLNYVCPSNFNPADFYIHTLAVTPTDQQNSQRQIRRICDNFDASTHSARVLATIRSNSDSEASSHMHAQFVTRAMCKRSCGVGWLVQFYWLLWRAMLDSVRNPAVHWVRIVQKILMAIVAGLCYSHVTVSQYGIKSIQGLMFVLVTENTFPALYGVLSLFPKELPLFLREQKSRMYSTSCFYLSRVISLIPGLVLDPVLFVSILYCFAPFRRDITSVCLMLSVAVFTCNTAAACGSFFSAAFDNVPMAIALLIPFDYLLMITGGLFLKLSTMPAWLGWAKSLSWFKYANEAFSIIQWRNVTDLPCPAAANATTACLHSGTEVLERYTFSVSDFPLDIAGMTALYIAFHALGMTALWLRTRRS